MSHACTVHNKLDFTYSRKKSNVQPAPKLVKHYQEHYVLMSYTEFHQNRPKMWKLRITSNCPPPPQRKNSNIIEQVTDFKYLGYRISEYGSDLEDKLQNIKQNKRSYTETFWKTNEQRNKVKNSQHYS